jgi:acyl-CoA hydrolase
MDIQQRIEKSKISIIKAVFSNTTNHYETFAIHLMNEITFIVAKRFTRNRVVTLSSDIIYTYI